MPTLPELGKILTACRVVSAARWQRVANRGGDDLARTLDALAAEPPEWWPAGANDAPPGLTEYQRGVIEAWFERTGEGSVQRQLALNQFILLEKLGEGGQGAVFRARQLSPARFVAVKRLSQDSDARRARFEQEARALMRIQHPSVARFHLYERLRDAAGKPTDEYLIAMEYIEGIDLSRLLRLHGPAPWQFVVRWAAQILDGLDVIHRAGLIHRDVKPGNVMVLGPAPEEGVRPSATSAKLLDFGAVKPTADVAAPGGKKRVFVGTREYAAPEQWAEEPVPESDLYSLGATLFHALAGRPPYEVEGREANAFMRVHARAPIPDVTDFAANLPDELNALLRRMLAKSPFVRGTAAELADEFRQLLPPGERDAEEFPAPRPILAVRPKLPEKTDDESPGGASHGALHAVTNPIFTLLERIYLPSSLRPPAGHEPPTLVRVTVLLRRPLVLATLFVLLALLVWWAW